MNETAKRLATWLVAVALIGGLALGLGLWTRSTRYCGQFHTEHNVLTGRETSVPTRCR